MQPQLVVIDTLQGIKELKAYLKEQTFTAYDVETTGLTRRHEIIGYSICCEENKAYYVILQKWNPTLGILQPILGNYEASKDLIRDLAKKPTIMHNGIFDCMMTEAYFKVSLIDSLHTDTMVLAHLLNENRLIGLKDLGVTEFNIDAKKEKREMDISIETNGGNTSKVNYELYKGDAYLVGKYGAKDAWLTYMLFNKFVPELFEQGLDKFFYEEESMPLLRGPTYQLNTVGLQVDLQALAKLKKQLEAEILEANAFIYSEIQEHIKDKYPGTNKKNQFNVGSAQQLSWLLFGKLELEFNTLTDAGKKLCKHMGTKVPYTFKAKRDIIREFESECEHRYQALLSTGKKVTKVSHWKYFACDKEALEKHAAKLKWVAALLEVQKKKKLLSTYVKGIETGTHYGIINPSFKQTGTTSGRYSSSRPNWQNLPRDDKRIKSCIISRPGKVFVEADQSQLEPRVFAFYAKDERLLASFKGTEDFYSVIGMEVFGKYDCTPHKDGSPDAFGIKYKSLRDIAKVIALSSTYGSTAFQLAKKTKKSVEATEQDMENYFERFEGVRELMLESHRLVKKDGQVTNIFGRPRRIPEAKRIAQIYGNKSHAELPYEVRNLLNLAVNHRIQSTAASIVNRAMIKFHENCKEAGIKAYLVSQVHDSLIAECDEADAEGVALIMQDALENAVQLQGVSFEAIPRISNSLAG